MRIKLQELNGDKIPTSIQLIEKGKLAPTRGLVNKTASNVYKPVKDVTFGEFLAYKSTKSYTEGDMFRVHLLADQPVFAYVINLDSRNIGTTLFPSNDENGNPMSAAMSIAGDEILLQSVSGQAIAFDENKGLEYLCVLLSKEELDIEQVTHSIQSASGTFFQG
ncbi:MAG: hypothetical protein IPN86_20880 [Saprospiraceae bacterium]|nr:hypothetical protein [Saprospiraceae bacterium]